MAAYPDKLPADANCPTAIAPAPSPWGFWMTVLFSAVIILLWFAAQVITTIVFVVVAKIMHPEMDADSFKANGLLLAIATCVGAPVAIGGSAFFAGLRGGISLREYLHLQQPAKGQYTRWFIWLIGFAALSDVVTMLAGKPIVPEFMVEAYTSAGFAPLLWIATVIGAPIGEEVIYRGFMFEGILHSRAGAVGAIGIPAFLWASLHVQYDMYGIATVFVGGLLLGVARLKSKSLYVPVLMHALWGLIATVETAIYTGMVTN